MKNIPLYGSMLEYSEPYHADNPIVTIPGFDFKGKNFFSINEEILSKHLLLIGGTGSGKTNLFYHIVGQIKKRMTKDDVMIIFDTKGDYLKLFYDKTKDSLIGNSKRYQAVSSTWNIFKEILADGDEQQSIESNINEISWTIFQEAIEKNKSQPFFPNAARDLFAAVLTYIVRIGINDLQFKRDFFNNKSLKKYFDMIDASTLAKMLGSVSDLKSVISYIGDGSSGQALGVFAELQAVVRKLFVGTFAQDGRFSVRNFVREKQGRTLFVEYDMFVGNVLTPLYQLLFDLALKESLGRERREGNVYLICDEFKLLPHLSHIEDAVNFGRGLGVKVFAGLQSITQLYENYGEARGNNIAAGFSSVFSFHANDMKTREFTTGLYGKNIVLEQYKTHDNMIKQEKREGNIVEDWDICNLNVGEAIISMPFYPPFKFKSELFTLGD